MSTYIVHIKLVEYYTITVDAKDPEEAEENAWRLYPHHSPDYGESNVTDVTLYEPKETP
jgi:hypothetical protein